LFKIKPFKNFNGGKVSSILASTRTYGRIYVSNGAKHIVIGVSSLQVMEEQRYQQSNKESKPNLL
jgi:hypothetical protein